MRLQIPTPAANPYRVMIPRSGYSSLGGLRGLGTVTAPVGTIALTATSTALATAAAVTPPPADIILGAAAAVTALLAKFGVGTGCGSTCTQATSIVNQAEPYLNQNITNYFALPAPRTQSQQAAALQQANAIMQGVMAACQAIPAPGGTQCVADRQAGACTWKQTTTSSLLSIPGEPQPGECWNWQNGYIDPIANDPDVVPDSAVIASNATGTSVVGAASSPSSSTMFLVAAAVLGLLALGSAN